MAQQKVYLGLDLCADNSQLSYYNEETQEPESICQLHTMDTYLLPNAAYYGEETKTWFVGSEAIHRRFEEAGTLIENVVEQCQMNPTKRMYFGDEQYSYQDILYLVLRGHIDEFLSRNEDSKIQRFVITVYQYAKEIVDPLLQIKDYYGLNEDSFFLIGHTSAYLHFVFHQPEELRNNSVALFDYGIEGLHYYQVDIARKNSPQLVTVTHTDYSKQMVYYRSYRNLAELDEVFAGIAKEVLGKCYISCVYLTGVGYLEPWLVESQKILCAGRRVFVGQNIYAKGACYAAYSGSRVIDPGQYIVNAEEMVQSDIGVLKGDGKNTFVPIARGGREWYNMRGKRFLFLDDTNRVELLYKNHYTNEAMREIIEIHGLPTRPNKTTKLSLEIEMYNAKSGAVVIRDEGFGKLFPTTNKIYRKEFTLESNL